MTTQPAPIDPEQVHRSPFFTQGMVVSTPRTLYVGGQNGADASGTLLEGLEAQTVQAMRNLLAVLEAAGTDADHVAKLTIYLAPGEDAQAGYMAAASVWGERRTAITVIAAAPARPGALVEIEAVAAIPD